MYKLEKFKELLEKTIKHHGYSIKKDEEFLYQNMIKTKELKEQLIKMYEEALK